VHDINTNLDTYVEYINPTIQPNDILKISVETIVPEAALPYNKIISSSGQLNTFELLKLEGYLVSNTQTIMFPVLGSISVKNLSTLTLEEKLKELLETGGHLVNPSVSVRLLNAKVTILGEVNKPGTYSFTEQSITLLQALGYANDLTINGKRDGVMVIREKDGVRTVGRINLTSAGFIESPFYYIMPNDVVVVNQNSAKVKSAGFIGNSGTVLTIASLVLSSIVLLTR
jgi:polysaccharide export outer membrane protein